jgi:hypothetical protein
MGFSNQIKRAIEKRAHFACCICFAKGVQIHHIDSQADGGSDKEENGAPLCPNCHETYGANPTKKRFIRDARNAWYEICSKRFLEKVSEVTTKIDITKLTATKKEVKISIYSFIASIYAAEHLEYRGKIEVMETCYSLLKIILGKGFWVDEDERTIKARFIRLYGEITACRLLLFIMKGAKVKLGRGLTPVQFADLLGNFKAAIYMVLLVKTVHKEDHGLVLGIRGGLLTASIENNVK